MKQKFNAEKYENHWTEEEKNHFLNIRYINFIFIEIHHKNSIHINLSQSIFITKIKFQFKLSVELQLIRKSKYVIRRCRIIAPKCHRF